MTFHRALLLLPPALLAVAAQAHAQTAPCPEPLVPMATLRSVTWHGETITAGTRSDDAPAILPGKVWVATLHPVARVAFVPALTKPAASRDGGGLLRFTATAAGVYRLMLGAHAWIDVARNGRVLTSVGHGPGVCTGYVKFVDFRLEPGDYVVQLSAATAPTLAVEIAPKTP